MLKNLSVNLGLVGTRSESRRRKTYPRLACLVATTKTVIRDIRQVFDQVPVDVSQSPRRRQRTTGRTVVVMPPRVLWSPSFAQPGACGRPDGALHSKYLTEAQIAAPRPFDLSKGGPIVELKG